MKSNKLMNSLTEIETLIQARNTIGGNDIAITSMNQLIASKVSHVCNDTTKRHYVEDGALYLSKLAVIKKALASLNFDLRVLNSLMNAIIRQMCNENNIPFQTVDVRGVVWSRAARKLRIAFARPRARPPVIICIELAQENDIYKLLNKIQSTSSSLWIESHPPEDLEHVFAKQAQKEYAEDWMEAMNLEGKKEQCSLESGVSFEKSCEIEKAVELTKVFEPKNSLEAEEFIEPEVSSGPEKTASGCMSALTKWRLGMRKQS
ncbi:MAG: hypothetical protein Q9208_007500 [Pyrenodesmia sp. 3 TL-2023]